MGIEKRFSEQDAERLIVEIVRDLRSDKLMRRRTAACALLGLHGLRISEVCNLLPTDLNPSTWLLSVRTIKRGVPRVVPIGAAWQKLLLPVFRQCGGRHLISTQGGRRLKPDQIRKQLRRLYARVLGDEPPKGFSFHALRHTFASRALTAVDARGEKPGVKDMQRALGHKSARSTEEYLHGGADLPASAWPQTPREKAGGPRRQLRIWVPDDFEEAG